MSIIEDYAEKAFIERTEDDERNDTELRPVVRFSSFILRVSTPSDN